MKALDENNCRFCDHTRINHNFEPLCKYAVEQPNKYVPAEKCLLRFIVRKNVVIKSQSKQIDKLEVSKQRLMKFLKSLIPQTWMITTQFGPWYYEAKKLIQEESK